MPTTPTSNNTTVGTVNNGANATANNGSTTTLAPSQQQGQTNNVNGTSAPLAQQSNIMINNNQSSQDSFGSGVTCQSATVAVSGYDGQQSATGYTNSSNYGVNASLIIPIGSRVQSNCTSLSTEIVKQRKLDTCITLIKADLEIDQALAPELFTQCSMIHRRVVTVEPVPAPQPVYVPVVQRVPYVVEHTTVKVVHQEEACDGTLSQDDIYTLVDRQKYLMRHHLGIKSNTELTHIRHTLDKVCNQRLVSQALDDLNAANLP